MLDKTSSVIFKRREALQFNFSTLNFLGSWMHLLPIQCVKMDKSERLLQNAKDNWDGCITKDFATCSQVTTKLS